MLEALAQTTTYTFDDSSLTTAEAGGLAIFGGVFLLVWLAIAVVMIVSMWKIFEKAGVEGWKAIIPIYNTYVLAEIVGKPGWWGLVVSLIGLVSWIPVLGWIASIGAVVIWVILLNELSKAFGKDTVFTVLLVLLPFIGTPILGFGDAKYTKPAAPKKA